MQVAWSTMHDEFSRLLLLLPKKKDEFMEDGSDDIFDKLKLYVLESCRASHRWGSKAEHSLVSVVLFAPSSVDLSVFGVPVV